MDYIFIIISLVFYMVASSEFYLRFVFFNGLNRIILFIIKTILLALSISSVFLSIKNLTGWPSYKSENEWISSGVIFVGILIFLVPFIKLVFERNFKS